MMPDQSPTTALDNAMRDFAVCHDRQTQTALAYRQMLQLHDAAKLAITQKVTGDPAFRNAEQRACAIKERLAAHPFSADVICAEVAKYEADQAVLLAFETLKTERRKIEYRTMELRVRAEQMAADYSTDPDVRYSIIEEMQNQDDQIPAMWQEFDELPF